LTVPDGTMCSGTVDNLANICLVKISNLNRAGPFGGVFAVQQVQRSEAGNQYGRRAATTFTA